jgi:hypothetical protein
VKNCYCTRQEDSQHEVLGDINVRIVHNHNEKLEHVKPNVCVITSIGKDKSLGSSHKWTLSTYLVIYWHMMFHIKTRIHVKPNNTSIQYNISPFVNELNLLKCEKFAILQGLYFKC